MERAFYVFLLLFGIFYSSSAKATDLLVYPFASSQDHRVFNDFDGHASYCIGCQGVDYDVVHGTPVYASFSGTVTVETGHPDQEDAQGCDSSNINYGNYVRIESGDWRLWYGHLTDGGITVASGDYVEAGDLIGYTSNSGFTCGADYVTNTLGSSYHLHYELEYYGTDVDPYVYLGGVFIIDDDGSYRYPSEVGEEEPEEEEEEDTGSPEPEPDPEPIGYPFTYLDGIASTDLYNYYSLAQYDTDSVKNEADITPASTGRPSTTLAVLAADVNDDGDDDIVRVYTTSTAGAVYVYRTSDTNPGTIGQRQTWKSVGREIHEAFIGDTDGDGLPDLILAFDTGTNSKVEWKICLNDGSKFADSCTLWQTDNNDTFGQTGDTFLVADFNGNGQVEILRGRTGSSTCSTSTLWKRLSNGGAIHTLDVQSGSSGTVQDCLGYAGSTFLAADVDNDGSDELVYLKTTSSTVVAYVADYSNTEPDKRLIYNQWASDVGGSSAYYCLNDLSGNGYLDLIRWSSSTLNYSVNNGSSFQEQTSQTKVMNLSQGGNDHLVCGQFEQ